MRNLEQSPYIFYLSLEDALPKTFYIFNHYLKKLNFILVPVKLDQLQKLIAFSDQEQVIVIASISDSREYKLYNEKVRGFLKFILKSDRLTFMHFSSFSTLSDKKKYFSKKNYHFFKYPQNARSLCSKIATYYRLKNEQHSTWPGGRRATLSSEVL